MEPKTMIPINDQCINLIKSFETLVLHPYHGKADRPGVFTIGYGTTKYPHWYMNGKMVRLTDPSISEAMAERFLQDDLNQKSIAIQSLVRVDLSPNQFGALLSFAYNLGEGALKESTLRQKVNQDKLDPTIREEFMKWVHANGTVQPGLVRRRKEEADLYFRS